MKLLPMLGQICVLLGTENEKIFVWWVFLSFFMSYNVKEGDDVYFTPTTSNAVLHTSNYG